MSINTNGLKQIVGVAGNLRLIDNNNSLKLLSLGIVKDENGFKTEILIPEIFSSFIIKMPIPKEMEVDIQNSLCNNKEG